MSRVFRILYPKKKSTPKSFVSTQKPLVVFALRDEGTQALPTDECRTPTLKNPQECLDALKLNKSKEDQENDCDGKNSENGGQRCHCHDRRACHVERRMLRPDKHKSADVLAN